MILEVLLIFTYVVGAWKTYIAYGVVIQDIDMILLFEFKGLILCKNIMMLLQLLSVTWIHDIWPCVDDIEEIDDILSYRLDCFLMMRMFMLFSLYISTIG